jgi:YVTN family beta-propeller protein
LTVIDGTTGATSGVTVGSVPQVAAVNPVTNKIYVINVYDNTVTIVDGATNSTSTVPVGLQPWAIAVNPVTNQIYVANDSGSSVTVIDGATNATTTVALSIYPSAIAVNPVTNNIYALGYNVTTAGESVVVIDGATNSPTVLASDFKYDGLAVNPVTNNIYLIGDNSTAPYYNEVTVIDGATNAVTAVVEINPADVAGLEVAVNPITNKIYAFDNLAGSMWIIDGATNTTMKANVGGNPLGSVVVNPATNKIYATNYGSTVDVIDGITNTVTTVATGQSPQSLALDPITNTVFAGNNGSDNLTAIKEQQVAPNPLTASVTPLSGNVTSNSSQSFSFTASSAYAPNAPQIENVYYQLDTWQGEWLPATGTAPDFTGQISNLQLGTHILYFWAADASLATDLSVGGSSIGAIEAYAFTVVNSNDGVSGNTEGQIKSSHVGAANKKR